MDFICRIGRHINSHVWHNQEWKRTSFGAIKEVDSAILINTMQLPMLPGTSSKDLLDRERST
jgi:hypothetical protein